MTDSCAPTRSNIFPSPDDPWAVECRCGNRPDLDGFESINEYGNATEGWTGIVHCDRCASTGRLVQDADARILTVATFTPGGRYVGRHRTEEA